MENTKELATAALTLLERADLKGSEMKAYVAVYNWLYPMTQEKVKGEEVVDQDNQNT